MSVADDAYTYAVKMIAEAKVSGVKKLDFDIDATHSLTHLPPEITDLAALQRLDLQNTQITDFTLLAALTGLSTLYLNNSQITDLTPLAALMELSTLYLDNTQITDFTPLAALTGLRSLSLDNTQITDLTPLAALAGLRSLWLNNTQITDFSPLAVLTELSTLSLDNAQITDFTLLAALTGLRSLWVNNSQITDFTPLVALTGLSTLSLDNTQITDLTPLAALTGLSTLSLDNTQITDFTPLAALTGLSSLSLDNTQITDLTPISAMTGLSALSLKNTQITDLTPLAAITALSWLWLDNSAASDLRPLRALTLLLENPGPFGLRFKNTAATLSDPRIAEIAEIEHNATRARELFDYLKDWAPPPDVSELPPQDPTGLRYDLSEDGRLDYERLVLLSAPPPMLSQLHVLLVEDATEMLRLFPLGHNESHGPLGNKLRRYIGALGDNLADVQPVLLWKAGNDLRILLRRNADRMFNQIEGMDKFGPDMAGGLEALLASHNIFASLHPDLAALDTAQIDPVDQQKAEADRTAMEATITLLAPHNHLIVEGVVADLFDLHAEAREESAAGHRALRIEIDSLHNLISEILAQALLQARTPSVATRVGGDIRAAVVGAGVSAFGGVAVTNFAQLAALLQPEIAVVLAASHGQGYPLVQALDWFRAKFKDTLPITPKVGRGTPRL